MAERAAAEQAARLRLALWRLDSLVAPLLAREHNRPFDHYSAIFAPPLAFDNRGACQTPGTVLEPSPLLGADLPEWMLLHFQVTCKGWESPQAPSASLLRRLSDPRIQAALHQTNVTPQPRPAGGSLAPFARRPDVGHRPAADRAGHPARHDLDACPEHRDPGSMAASGACAEPGISGPGHSPKADQSLEQHRQHEPDWAIQQRLQHAGSTTAPNCKASKGNSRSASRATSP